MGKDYSRKLFYSRLARREEKRNLRKAFIFGFLTLILLITLAFFGIPTLIRLTLFLSDIKGTNTPIEQTDTIPPATPRLNPLPEYVKDQSLSVSGSAEPGSTVELFLNGSPVGTMVTATEGSFTFAKVDLSSGQNVLYAIATDQAGNKSQSSPKTTLTLDNTPPKLEIIEPPDGSAFKGERKKQLKISGQTEAGNSLTVNDRFTIIDQEGNLSTTYSLNEGENLIKVVATDLAGNQTEKELKITYVP